MSTTKFVSVDNVTLLLDATGMGAKDDNNVVRIGGAVRIARLTRGMESGQSAVFIEVRTDDGAVVMVEMSLAMLRSAVRAFDARDKLEGLPS